MTATTAGSSTTRSCPARSRAARVTTSCTAAKPVDYISGGPGNDDIRGFDGDDNLYGDAGDDEIHGNDGGDYIYGDGGTDKIYGEAGTDKRLRRCGLRLLVRRDRQGLADRRRRVQHDHRRAGNDVIKSSSGVLRGGEGNDEITGYGENYGDDGDDVLTAGSETFGGARYRHPRSVRPRQRVPGLAGQPGNDRYMPDCDDVFGCPVVAQQNAHDDLEIVLGTPYNDEITGNVKVNDLRGGAGNDRIWGLDGEDKLDAQAGTNQHLNGGNDLDSCFGAGTLSYTSCEIR